VSAAEGSEPGPRSARTCANTGAREEPAGNERTLFSGSAEANWNVHRSSAANALANTSVNTATASGNWSTVTICSADDVHPSSGYDFLLIRR